MNLRDLGNKLLALKNIFSYWQKVFLLVLAKHGFVGDVPMSDISTKAKALEYIGLKIDVLKENNMKFLDEIVPKWVEEAKAKGMLIEI